MCRRPAAAASGRARLGAASISIGLWYSLTDGARKVQAGGRCSRYGRAAVDIFEASDPDIFAKIEKIRPWAVDTP
jgi:hypothetical protein